MTPVLGGINRPAHYSEGLNESEIPISVLLCILSFQGQRYRVSLETISVCWQLNSVMYSIDIKCIKCFNETQ